MDNSTSSETGDEIVLTAPEDASGRLDRWLSQQTDALDLSRSRIKTLIVSGQLSASGAVLTDPSASVRPGLSYRLVLPAAEEPVPQPESIPLDILFEDQHLIVLNKAAGMVVHPAPGSLTGTLVNALLAHCGDSLTGIGGVMRPGIVHRLDKDTSGVMVAAKTQKAHTGLSELFAAHDIDRRYQAVVWGMMTEARGRVDAPIARHKTDRKRQTITPSGKHAVTHYQLERSFPPFASLVTCELETGRTHQIRVHMTSLGHGLIGDAVYGRPLRAGQMPDRTSREILEMIRRFPRQALHAAHLGFTHPCTGEALSFTQPLPDDMAGLITDIETAMRRRVQM